MILIATVVDWPVVLGGEAHTGWLPPGAAVPAETPTRALALSLRILREDSPNGGYILAWDAPDAASDGGDSWHPTLEDAIAQARATFGIPASEWERSQ